MIQTTSRPPTIKSFRHAVRLLLAALAVTTLAVLTACGGSSDSGSSDKSSHSASAPASKKGPGKSASNSKGGSAKSGDKKSASKKKPSIKPSKNLDKISVSGSKPGKAPKVKVDKPWAINKTRTKVLHSGHGDKVHQKGSVQVNYTGVDGRTGKTFESTFKKKSKPATFTLDKVIPGFKKGLAGKKVGDRVLIAMAPKDGYASVPAQQRQQMQQQLQKQGIKFDDTLVFVADITSTTLEHAKGKKVAAKSGLPKFSASDDKPKISTPDSDPPKKATARPLIKGKGAKVKSSDTVTTKSVTALWKNGKIVDNSWKKSWAPQPQQQQQQQQGQKPKKRLPAMSKAMAGHRVGDRLLIVWPPGTAYKKGDSDQGIGRDDTVVMVVDILFTQPKQ